MTQLSKVKQNIHEHKEKIMQLKKKQKKTQEPNQAL